ncbi:hypothetical protein ACFVT9_29175 [Kitasatospora cineracea]|uniref:hypothetical protein n=1 Tax=Kitasatospora cineracea TaxID=88074 RepID=UPI0036DF72AB
MNRTHLPVGPALTVPLLAMVSMAAGRHLQYAHLNPTPWADRSRFDDLDVLTAVYLVTDAAGRLRWLGQASRADGLTGRLNDHDAAPAKRAAFAAVRVLHLADHTPPEALDAIEGRCADVLGVRGGMRPLRWPPSTGWLSLVA